MKTMKANTRQLLALAKAAAKAWSEDYAPSMGAALAYYTVFSVAPLVLIVISVAGLIFGADAARGAILGQLQGLMGIEGAQAVEAMLKSVREPGDSAIATAVGVLVLLVGATTVFGELQDALDRIWRAPVRDRTGGVWKLLRTRLLSFGMILGIGFLLMVSLVLSAALSALGRWWSPLFGGWEVLAQAVNFLVSFGLVTTVFAMIYKIMPRVHVKWHDVWLGAGVTALLFSIGKLAIGLYIGKSGVASGYGAAGSLIVLLVWVYYSAQIFLMGAEFTWVYANTLGSRRHAKAAIPALPAIPSATPAPAMPGTPAPLGASVPVHGFRTPSSRSAAAAGGALLAGAALQVLSLVLRRRRRVGVARAKR